MSRTFNQLHLDFQTFIVLDCQIAGIPQPQPTSPVEFSEHAPQPGENEQVYHLSREFGAIIRSRGQPPRLQLTEKGRAVLEQIEQREQ